MTCPLCNPSFENLLWENKFLRIIQIKSADYPGYCQIIWKKHTVEQSELTNKELYILFFTLRAVEKIILSTMECDKINLASLGNFVPHLHWHIIPRFVNDKHFPESIWGKKQREPSNEILTKRQIRAKFLAVSIQNTLVNSDL